MLPGRRLLLISVLVLLSACGRETVPPQVAADSSPQSASSGAPGLVTIRAVGMSFQGPETIPAGWTTFRFENTSAMVHFAMIDRPPAQVDLQTFDEQLMAPFQLAMDAMNANDEAAVNAAYATFPAWVGDLERHGGPGLLSAGLVGQTTVFLAPGRYVLECYVKTDGVFHTTSPGNGQLGMVLEFTVTSEDNGALEPRANARFTLSNSGITLEEGALRAGSNTIRVDFAEQQALPSFVGNDIHLLQLSGPRDLQAAAEWMDWRTPDGLQSPSPVRFLGGIQDMAAGRHGYFSVDLEPGDYALMAEVPEPLGMGLVLPVSVSGP
ncbi:hypothetical protein E2F43_03425 [Seongchinamella unica]|uniref:Uncharacterized protein n=1 Tax=Seongchinamella unica TaxID=2547392 RepID=A0A4R5LVP2_9GAMM|nr:hypothetical protein [Seongchinamella unica]TDG15298.1 hypothetical protein E2F43_03425 [Seongchinamella unica]